MWLIRFIMLLAIMWYMVARDICSRLNYKTINDGSQILCRNSGVQGRFGPLSAHALEGYSSQLVCEWLISDF